MFVRNTSLDVCEKLQVSREGHLVQRVEYSTRTYLGVYESHVPLHQPQLHVGATALYISKPIPGLELRLTLCACESQASNVSPLVRKLSCLAYLCNTARLRLQVSSQRNHDCSATRARPSSNWQCASLIDIVLKDRETHH